MSQTIFLEYFDMIIDEIVDEHIRCRYCHEVVPEENEICEGCELSLELLESFLVSAEA